VTCIESVQLLQENSAKPLFEYMEEQIRSTGMAVCRLNDPEIETTELALMAHRLHRRVTSLGERQLEAAGIGRQQDFSKNRDIRRDRIHWLAREHHAEQGWLDFMEQLRLHMNRYLMLGLFSHECHFAHYPPGAFYKRHMDAFKGQSNRILTTVFYLNPQWQAEDGGELVIYNDADSDRVRAQLLPEFGTLVSFLSEEFPHEVLAAQRDRYSIAGWFRINSSLNGVIDPPG